MSTWKNTNRLDPDAAFPDESTAPTEAELNAILGPDAARIEELVTRLRARRPAVTTEWKYSDRSGWYRVYLLKDRRVFYLVPKRDGFRVSLILGDKALGDLQRGPLARRVTTLLKSAKRYPEGTAFTFDRDNLDAGVLAALAAAKLAH